MNDEHKIKEIISNQLGISIQELTPNADLRQDLNAEEIEIADLLTKLEKEFATKIHLDESITIKTVSDIVEFFKES